MPRQPRLLPCLTFAAACLLATPAFAQETAPKEKPFKLGEAVDAPDWLTLSGSVRPRYETLGDTFYAGRSGGDELLSVQMLLKAEIDTGEIIIGGELLDSRLLSGNAGGGAAGEVDALEPAQLYLAWRPKDFLAAGASLDLTVGRFTMDIGSRRLVARANYRSILSGFDGVRGVWTSADKLKVTAFYTAPTARMPSDAPSALDNEVVLNTSLDNVRFGGAHVETPLPFGMLGEAYVLDLDEDDADGRATRNRDLSTLGVRLRQLPKASAFDFDLEYAHQTGSARATTGAADVTDLDHDASMFHIESGFSFVAPWSPRIALQYDFASGDESPSDPDSGRFDPLFGDRSFEFGPTSIYGAISRTNLASPGVRLEVKPDMASDAYVMVRRIGLDSATDSFANSGVRDAAGLSGDNVGTQIEGRYRRWLVQDSVRMTLGAAYIARGEFLEDAPNTTGEDDPLFGFAEVQWTF